MVENQKEKGITEGQREKERIIEVDTISRKKVQRKN